MERLTKANEMLCRCEDCWTDEEHCPQCNFEEGNCQYIKEVIEKLAGYEDTGLTPQEITEGKMLTGWIPVEERLPQTGKDRYTYVIVCMDDEFIATTDYIKDEGFSLWEDSGEVIAWMPLPEPYKEGK